MLRAKDVPDITLTISRQGLADGTGVLRRTSRHEMLTRIMWLAGAAGTLRCVVDDLPILPGRYRVSVWLSHRHVDYDVRNDVAAAEVVGVSPATAAIRGPDRIFGLAWPLVD